MGVVLKKSPKRTPAKKPAPAPVPALAPTVGFFLIGENAKVAGDVAEHEWGWKRTKGGWTDPTGNAIKFLADFGAVKEASKKAPVSLYPGYRWYASIAPHMLDSLRESGRVVVLPEPKVLI